MVGALSLRCQVAVFVRAPVLGQVKTRLAEDVGSAAALAIYRDLGRSLVNRLSTDPVQWDLRIYHTPDDKAARAKISAWLDVPDMWLYAQGEGDLGERMSRAVRAGVATGARVCLVGSDIPELGPEHVAAAFGALERGADLVLGPCHDGGYYLMGQREHHPALFQNMPWSSSEVFAITCARAKELGLSVHTLPILRDVDHAEDLTYNR